MRANVVRIPLPVDNDRTDVGLQKALHDSFKLQGGRLDGPLRSIFTITSKFRDSELIDLEMQSVRREDQTIHLRYRAELRFPTDRPGETYIVDSSVEVMGSIQGKFIVFKGQQESSQAKAHTP